MYFQALVTISMGKMGKACFSRVEVLVLTRLNKYTMSRCNRNKPITVLISLINTSFTSGAFKLI